MKKYIMVLFFVFGAIGAFAQTQGPVTIFADTVSYKEQESKSLFTGNVVVSSNIYTLTTNRLEVVFAGNNEIKTLKCWGNVNFKSDNISAVADNADLSQVTKIINLSGKAKIWQGNNYMEGESMRLNYETREIAGHKGKGDRVVIVFTPDDNGTIIFGGQGDK